MIDAPLSLDAQLGAQLRAASTAWIGTVRPDGAPHVVPVWFQWEDGAFLVFNQPADQKVKNLLHSSRVTLGIPLNPESTSVAIFHGEAEIGEARTSVALPPEYLAKYRDQIDAYGWNEHEMAAQYSVPIRIRPTRLISW